MYKNKADQITEVINHYFDGVFYGDVEKLKDAFHVSAFLYGDIKGVEYLKSLDEYLQGVKNRKSPHEQNEKYEMKILGLEIWGNVAIAKVHLPMLGFNYYDFLSLSLIKGKWKIVNKIFTHVE